MMGPPVRKAFLTAHVTFSVGWLGAVAAFLVLSVAGVASHDANVVRAAYLAMNLIGQYMIVPLSLAALATGLVQSLGTHWGLFKHYWVLVKFTLTIGATILLILHQLTAVAAAARAAGTAAPGAFPDVHSLGAQLVGDAGLGLLALIAVTTLSVFKPWGRTAYGERGRVNAARLAGDRRAGRAPAGLKIFVAVVALITLGFGIAKHLASGLSHHHH
ncbi:MAG TPA: hypothetical protein VII52_11495 [Gemmatimonadaceae bacterium]